jgi:rhodanese-related sulfurtransferase
MQQIQPTELGAWLADPGKPAVVAICHHGGRSHHAGLFLEKNGFSQIHNLAGGVDAWAKTVDPAMPKY